MKPGDIVRHTPEGLVSTQVGIVIDTIEKKCWRTSVQGKKINWGTIDPEPHAVVLYPHNDGTIEIPFVDLEVVYESR